MYFDATYYIGRYFQTETNLLNLLRKITGYVHRNFIVNYGN